MGKLLAETRAGSHAPGVEDIKNSLRKLYQEYRLNGAAAFEGEESKINQYSHREMARRFAEILDHLV